MIFRENIMNRFTLLMITAMLLVSGAAYSQSISGAATGDPVRDIRLMLTAPDNGMFEFWSTDEIVNAVIEIYYNDPVDADFHEQVVYGAVVLAGKTGDDRVLDMLIDAIDTHPTAALYALGNFPNVKALNALVGSIRLEDPSARENAAEGLRMMGAPSEIEDVDAWVAALDHGIAELTSWIAVEPEWDVKEYFQDARGNLQLMRQKALSH